MQKLLFLIAIVIGHIFAYIDSQPNFDDTGILAFSIAIASGIIAFISSRRPWFWALAVGIWIPLHNWIHNGSYGSVLALVFALAGAYLGSWLRKIVDRKNQSSPN
jgi:fructose-specific phosphotransferase system IIC component